MNGLMHGNAKRENEVTARVHVWMCSTPPTFALWQVQNRTTIFLRFEAGLTGFQLEFKGQQRPPRFPSGWRGSHPGPDRFEARLELI